MMEPGTTAMIHVVLGRDRLTRAVQVHTFSSTYSSEHTLKKSNKQQYQNYELFNIHTLY